MVREDLWATWKSGSTQGKAHNYLGMKLHYSEKKKIKIDMKDYVKRMFESCPIKFKEGETGTTPACEDYLVISQAMTRNYQRTRLKHFIQQWHKEYFLRREEDQIYTQELHFCVLRCKILMMENGKSLSD